MYEGFDLSAAHAVPECCAHYCFSAVFFFCLQNNQNDYVICGVKLPNSEDFQGEFWFGNWIYLRNIWIGYPELWQTDLLINQLIGQYFF